jgi:hypothetical protein
MTWWWKRRERLSNKKKFLTLLLNPLLTYPNPIWLWVLFNYIYRSCKKAGGMRVPPVRKVYHVSQREGLIWNTLLSKERVYVGIVTYTSASSRQPVPRADFHVFLWGGVQKIQGGVGIEPTTFGILAHWPSIFPKPARCGYTLRVTSHKHLIHLSTLHQHSKYHDY